MEKQNSDLDKQASIFSALADPTRLKLVRLLCRQQEPHALCVNALAGRLGVTQSAISQHLRILKSIGIVRGDRRGYHIHYFVNRDALEQFRKLTSAVLSLEEQDEEKSCQENCPRRKENVSSD